MRKRAIMFGAAALATTVVAVPAADAGPGRQELVAALSGTEEVPKVGNADSYGAAAVDFSRRNRVCFRIVAKNVENVTMGHIHRGKAGVAGPIVVPFFEGALPARTRCVRVTRTLSRQIRRNPDGFYVNVHTQEFPAGAIRGQLAR